MVTLVMIMIDDHQHHGHHDHDDGEQGENDLYIIGAVCLSVCVCVSKSHYFRIQGIWSFLMFIDTFRIQDILLFLLFIDTTF